MIVIKNIEEFASVHQTVLTSYLKRKFSSMVAEYGCTMADIGEVHIYQSDSEFLTMQEVNLSALEVIEIIQVSQLDYLHLVEIVDDYYAKDIYVPVNRKEVF
jgi:hypothetical protein